MATRDRTTLTDARGRKIVVVSLSVTDQYKLRAAIEPGCKGDDQAVGLAQACAMVVEIDGIPMLYPRTPAQLEANMDLLDDDGWICVLANMREKTRAAMEAIEKAGADPLAPSEKSPPAPALETPFTSLNTESPGT